MKRRLSGDARWLVRLLSFIVCGCSLAFHAAPSHAEPGIYVSTTYYDIVGTTTSELGEQIDALGPKDRVDHLDAAATTSWRIAYEWFYTESATGCAVKEVFVSAIIKYHFPRWENESGADDSTRQAWGRFMSALRTHEAGHAQHGEDGATEVEATLKSLPTQPTCEALKADVDAEADRIIKKYAALDIEYDRETKHGLTQGTYLPGSWFGAIAYDDGAFGWDYGAASAAAADRDALAQCAERAGDCKVVVRYSKGCVALAAGGSDFGAAQADNRDEAEAAALFACKRSSDSCIIATSSCAPP
jgi:predicted secreted Zn-dependent protease